MNRALAAGAMLSMSSCTEYDCALATEYGCALAAERIWALWAGDGAEAQAFSALWAELSPSKSALIDARLLAENERDLGFFNFIRV